MIIHFLTIHPKTLHLLPYTHLNFQDLSTKIYTKTGDKGDTALIGGTKVPKSHLRIEAYGTVDELNSYIGLCKDLLGNEQSRKLLLEIQDRLFTIGSALVTNPDKEVKMKLPDLYESDVVWLEKKIDELNPGDPLLIHCAGGYRSSIASSFLKSRGFKKVTNVHGGWNKIKHTDVAIEKDAG